MTTDIIEALVRERAPDALNDFTAKRRALDETAGDFQEARHQLRAAELGDDEQAEAIAVVRVRRAERRHAEASSVFRETERMFNALGARLRDQLMFARLQAWNRDFAQAQAQLRAEQQQLDARDAAAAALFDQRIQDELVPLQNAGAQLPRRLAATLLFDIEQPVFQ